MNISSRILVIIYYYTPWVSPRVIRWSAINKELVSLGFQVDVVCVAMHNLPFYEVIDGVNIYRVKPWFFKTIYRKNQAPNYINDVEHYETVLQRKNGLSIIKIIVFFKMGLISLFSRIYRAICWPDFGMFWIPPATRFVKKLISINSYKFVYAVSWPVNAHVVGKNLSNTLIKKSIPLIMDIGDPFSLNEFTSSKNSYIHKKINLNFEQKILELVNGIVVTTKETKEMYLKKFLISENLIKIIPPIYTGEKPKKNPKFNNDGFVLVYVGSFRKINRPPETLIRLFADLLKMNNREKLVLHLYGDYSECKDEIHLAKKHINDSLIIHGIVTHSDALHAMAASSALINIGNQSKNQLPSKLVDYVATGKPIINIQFVEDDTSINFLKKYPAVCNLNFRKNEYEENLIKIHKFINDLPNDVPESIINELLKMNMVSEITKKYLFDFG